MDIIIPDIEHKYITLFETQQGYDAAAPNFIEVNWSAVKDTEHPEETPVPYQPSTRPTHGYEPVDNVDVFPDSSVRMLWYTYDHIYKTFFLEIIWGYSGWEWVDYEYTDPDTQETTTLKGGNLYKVKEITTVPTIPDGYRLEHINNFLNSQDKVTHVEWFDTSHLKSMRSAFIGASSGSKHTTIFTLDCYDFPNVTDIYQAFSGRRLKIDSDNTLSFAKVTNTDGAFNGIRFVYPDVLKISIPNLSTANQILRGSDIVNFATFDINNIFVGNTLKNVSDFTMGMYSSKNNNSNNAATYATTIKLDLTGTELSASTVFNFTSFLESFGSISIYSIITFDLKCNNPMNLDKCLYSGNQSYKNLNLNGNEDKVRSIVLGFYGTGWHSQNNPFPYTQPLNEAVNDTQIFRSARIQDNVDYDFSPNLTIKNTYAHFDEAYLLGSTNVFRHVEYLNYLVFRPRAGFTSFPYTLWDSNLTYSCSVSNDNGYVDFTRFKYIQLGGTIQTIPAQTIYTCSFNPFSSTMTVDDSLIVHCCQKGVYYYDTFSINPKVFELNNNTMVKAPILYFHAIKTSGSATGDYEFIQETGVVNISGDLLEEIVIHIVNESVDQNPPFVNLEFSGANLVKVIIDGDNYRCKNNWNIRNCPNLDMSVFEQTLLRRQPGHYAAYYSAPTFTLLQSQWDALSSTCQTHCTDLFSAVNLVQENES